MGGIGEPCYANDTCDAGLQCIQGYCVPLDFDPVDASDATGDETGDTQITGCQEDLTTTGIVSNNVKVIDYSGQFTTAKIGQEYRLR